MVWSYDLESRFGMDNFSSIFSKDKIEIILVMLPSAQSKILDAGCGNGHITRLIANQGHEVTGVDISPTKICKAREQTSPATNINYIIGDIGKLNGVGIFDCIVASDVIEHIPQEPIITLQNLKKQLVQDGTLIVSAPYGIFNYDMGHIWREKLSWWEDVFQQAGFAVVESELAHFGIKNFKTTLQMDGIYKLI